ncbi:MAG TPA: hypothetical protein VFW68_06240 [Rhodocyclaceae bacterium]|nr:hypothetical protein [Rhodocyclaceae bacterium]
MNVKLTRAAFLLLTVFASSLCFAQSPCLSAVDGALAKDIEAATGESGKLPWGELEKRFVSAELAWGQAVKVCDGDLRDQALANQADAKRARTRAAGQVESAACDQSSNSAARLMGFAKDAWTAKRWDDAAMWSRKADLAWESAISQCNGGKRDEAMAKRAAARLDSHNALNCAPRWAKASELATALRSEWSALGDAEKQTRRDQIETAWNEAAKECKGAAGEKALASAQAFARERGDRPVSGLSVPVVRNEPIKQRSGDVTYVGQFKRDANGFMEGLGRVEWDGGDSYEGPLVAGKAQGRGVFVWKSGQRYEGDLVEGRPSGQGKMIYAESGDRYEGAFDGGIPHGQGTYTWKNGDRYTGGWANGQKHGHGRYVWADGRAWEGEYVKDERADGQVVLAKSEPPPKAE